MNSMENQNKILLPLNSITEKIWYTNDDTSNMRVLVSAYTDHPIAWKISKCEDANPKGIKTITLYQDFFNQHRDYIEKDETGKIVGLWADYYDYNIEPINPNISSHTSSTIYGKIIASTSTLKVGGSYKTLTLKLYNTDNEDITDNYSSVEFSWSCSLIDDNKMIDLSNKVTWLNGNLYNQKKIKFPDDRNYLNKTLDIKCNVGGIETIAQFELINS